MNDALKPSQRLDDYHLGSPPQVFDLINPNETADAVLDIYKKLLLKAIKADDFFQTITHAFSKNGSQVMRNNRTNIKKHSQIAVRLLYSSDHSKGLRVLSFSTELDFKCRCRAHLGGHLNQKLLQKHNHIIKEFIQISEATGFTTKLDTSQNGLVLIAEGICTKLMPACSVIVEMVLGQKDCVLFRRMVL